MMELEGRSKFDLSTGAVLQKSLLRKTCNCIGEIIAKFSDLCLGAGEVRSRVKRSKFSITLTVLEKCELINAW